MERTIFIDIETVETNRQDVRDYIAATVKPPATFKKAESIAKWHEEEGPQAIADAVAKTGMDGAFGRVVVVGLAFDDQDPITVSGDSEAQVLNDLNIALGQVPPSMHSAATLVGFNCNSFDIRFLFQRYVVNSIKPHPIINAAVTAKAWDSKVFDCMTQFAGYGNRISLDKTCLALGIPSPKGDIDGSMVNQFYLDGRLAEIAEYCKRDIVATRAVYKRLTFQG